MTWEAYNEVISAPHRASLTHELLAAAASYEGMKAWEDHKRRHGEAVDHARRNEIMAAAAGFFIDRMIETKGLDHIDRHRARRHAEEHFGRYEAPGYGGYAAPGYAAPYGAPGYAAPYGAPGYGMPPPPPFGAPGYGAPYGGPGYGYEGGWAPEGHHHHDHHHHHHGHHHHHRD